MTLNVALVCFGVSFPLAVVETVCQGGTHGGGGGVSGPRLRLLGDRKLMSYHRTVERTTEL